MGCSNTVFPVLLLSRVLICPQVQDSDSDNMEEDIGSDEVPVAVSIASLLYCHPLVLIVVHTTYHHFYDQQVLNMCRGKISREKSFADCLAQ